MTLSRYLRTTTIVEPVPLRWRLARAVRWPVISARWTGEVTVAARAVRSPVVPAREPSPPVTVEERLLWPPPVPDPVPLAVAVPPAA